MKKQFSFLGIMLIIILSSCGTQKALTKARESGVKMEYAFPGDFISYKQVQKIDQEIDAMGQIIDIKILSEVDFDTKKNAEEGENTKIDVKLNSISMGVNVMGQQMDPDLSELNGKEFHLVVSKKGEEVDTHEADEIVYQTSPDEKSSLGMIFNSAFPDVPGYAVNVNDSWKSKDSLYYRDGARYTQVVTDNTHTLSGFVELDGMACAEIKTTYEGYMRGKSFSQGQELLIEGKVTGEGTWYFDFVNGRLIKDSSTGLADGKIKMSMGEMTLKRTFNNTTELVK